MQIQAFVRGRLITLKVSHEKLRPDKSMYTAVFPEAEGARHL